MTNYDQKRCYILGAGASCDAHHPLVEKIITHFDSWLCRRDASEFRDKQGKSNEDDNTALSLYQDKLHPLIVEVQKSLPNNERNNIENIITALKNCDQDAYRQFEKILYWMFVHMTNRPEVSSSG